jgi:hypothetical protein
VEKVYNGLQCVDFIHKGYMLPLQWAYMSWKWWYDMGETKNVVVHWSNDEETTINDVDLISILVMTFDPAVEWVTDGCASSSGEPEHPIMIKYEQGVPVFFKQQLIWVRD